MSHTTITWMGWIVAVLGVWPHLWSWRRTYIFMRGIDRNLIWQMLHLCRFTNNLRILVLSLAMIGLLVCIPILGAPVPLGLLAMMVSVALVPSLRLTLPPTILFLTGSGERANTLLLRLHRAATPLRVVALLDPERMGSVGQMLLLDLMRTSDENMWKSMVHQLLDIAPVFVVDTVHRTAPVRYEAFLMLAPERVGRTIFISDDEGVCPSLQAEGIDPSEHAIPITRPNDLEKSVFRLLHMVSTQPKEAASTTGRMPIVPENWDSLPSLLTIGLVDGLDGKFLLAQARSTEKNLIALVVPLSSLDEDAANVSMELSWDFSRNPRLVGLYLETTGLVMVRREFILQNPELLDFHVDGIHPGNISFEDLDKPEPIGAAVHQLCCGWRRAAQQHGFEFRFALK
jgi:hypothetical protein